MLITHFWKGHRLTSDYKRIS